MYRVLPLPQSMYRYVYDFGTVSGKTENDYIKKIVKNQVMGIVLCDVVYIECSFPEVNIFQLLSKMQSRLL